MHLASLDGVAFLFLDHWTVTVTFICLTENFHRISIKKS